MSDMIRRVEDWATIQRGLVVLAAATVGPAASTTVSPGVFDYFAYASVAVGLAGMYVNTAAQRERCPECDGRVCPVVRYCDHCGHETGCDHDVEAAGAACPVCSEQQ